MRTLANYLSSFLLFCIFFGCLMMVPFRSCDSLIDTSKIGPFCSAEHITAPLFTELANDQTAVLAQKLDLILAIVSLSFLVILTKNPIKKIRIALPQLIRFGPYQKRYPMLLPSEQ